MGIDTEIVWRIGSIGSRISFWIKANKKQTPLNSQLLTYLRDDVWVLHKLLDFLQGLPDRREGSQPIGARGPINARIILSRLICWIKCYYPVLCRCLVTNSFLFFL